MIGNNMKLKTITKWAALIACTCLMAGKAQALTIPQFFAANPDVVGLVKDAVPFGDADRVVYVNNALGLGPNAVAVTVGTEKYWTGATDYRPDTVSLLDSSTPGTGVATIVGWDYLFVKYDGPNAGAIIYFLNGASFTPAATIADLGGINDGLPKTQTPKYDPEWKGGISGWTAYGAHHSVPDGGSTLALIGIGLTGLGLLRRKLS